MSKRTRNQSKNPKPLDSNRIPKITQPDTKRVAASLNFVFTLNNYTEEEVEEIDAIVGTEGCSVVYLDYGKEVGQEGTPHLQGQLECLAKGMSYVHVLVSEW